MNNRGTEVGQDHGNCWSRYLLTEVDNANANKWELRLFLHGLLTLKITALILLVNSCKV